MENVVVIGASTNEERYSNKAMKMLAEYGHNPIPVAPAAETILGRKAFAKPADVTGKVDTVTVYVGPARQEGLLPAGQRPVGGKPDQRAQVVAHAAAPSGTCAPSRKFRSIWCPCSEAMLSGWNCTPSMGRSRWRSPMMVPSSSQAVTSRLSGRLARSTISEW